MSPKRRVRPAEHLPDVGFAPGEKFAATFAALDVTDETRFTSAGWGATRASSNAGYSTISISRRQSGPRRGGLYRIRRAGRIRHLVRLADSLVGVWLQRDCDAFTAAPVRTKVGIGAATDRGWVGTGY